MIDGKWDEGEEVYIDDVKGGTLNSKDVYAGRKVEMAWVEKQKVFMKVPIEMARQECARIYDMKWIDTRKGDIVRSRLVVREIKARKGHQRKVGSINGVCSYATCRRSQGIDLAHADAEG